MKKNILNVFILVLLGMAQQLCGMQDISPVVTISNNAMILFAFFSPDEKQILTPGEGNSADLFDAQTGKLIYKLDHSSPVVVAAFSHDGKKIVTGSSNGTVILWDTGTGSMISTFNAHPKKINKVSFSHDDLKLATGAEDGIVKIWDVATGGSLLSLKAYEALKAPETSSGAMPSIGKKQAAIATPKAVSVIEFSSDASKLLTVAQDVAKKQSVAKIWDVATGTSLHTFPNVNIAHFSPDGIKLLTSAVQTISGQKYYGPIVLWSVEAGQKIATLVKEKEVSNPEEDRPTIAFSADGTKILTYTPDGFIGVWDGNIGTALGNLYKILGHEAYDSSKTIFSYHGDMVILVGENETVTIQDVQTHKTLTSFNPFGGEYKVLSVKFSPSDKKIITLSLGKVAKIWDVNVLKDAYKKSFEAESSMSSELKNETQDQAITRILNTKNPYEILGVSHKATIDDVNRAFRILSLKVHPDKNPENYASANEAFQKLNNANMFVIKEINEA